jgi:protein TonB
MCKFIVHPDGSINRISVIKGVEDSLDEEAVRIIREMPRWESAKHKGRSVPVYYVLTIPFRL